MQFDMDVNPEIETVFTPVTNVRTPVIDSAGSIRSPRSSASVIRNVRIAMRDPNRATGNAVASTDPLINARTTLADSTRSTTTRIGATFTASFTSVRNRRSGFATSQARNLFRNQRRLFSDNRTSIGADSTATVGGPTRPILRTNRNFNAARQTRNVFRNQRRYFSGRLVNSSDPNHISRMQESALQLRRRLMLDSEQYLLDSEQNLLDAQRNLLDAQRNLLDSEQNLLDVKQDLLDLKQDL